MSKRRTIQYESHVLETGERQQHEYTNHLSDPEESTSSNRQASTSSQQSSPNHPVNSSSNSTSYNGDRDHDEIEFEEEEEEEQEEEGGDTSDYESIQDYDEVYQSSNSVK